MRGTVPKTVVAFFECHVNELLDFLLYHKLKLVDVYRIFSKAKGRSQII